MFSSHNAFIKNYSTELSCSANLLLMSIKSASDEGCLSPILRQGLISPVRNTNHSAQLSAASRYPKHASFSRILRQRLIALFHRCCSVLGCSLPRCLHCHQFFSISKFSSPSIQSQCRTLLHRNGKGQISPMTHLLLAPVMLGLIPKRINPILSPMRCLLYRSPTALLQDLALQSRRLRQYLIIMNHHLRT